MNIVLRGHRCRSPFLFPFILFSFLFFLSSSFSLSFLSFSVSHSLQFLFRSFVLSSSCRFPFDSCIAFFAFSFACLLSLGGGFSCSVVSLRYYTSPALLASLKYACSPWQCVLSLLSCVADGVDLSSFFLLCLPFFDFGLDSVCFHPVFFLWVQYAVSLVSVSDATRLAYLCSYDIYKYIYVFVHTPISHFYCCLRCTICFSYIVCIIFSLYKYGVFVFLLI